MFEQITLEHVTIIILWSLLGNALLAMSDTPLARLKMGPISRFTFKITIILLAPFIMMYVIIKIDIIKKIKK